MQITVELSLYPLTENFEQVVIEYISEIKSNPGIKVEVNGLSTQVFGEYENVMKILAEVNRVTFEKHRCVILMKMAEGEKSVENLPDVLK